MSDKRTYEEGVEDAIKVLSNRVESLRALAQSLSPEIGACFFMHADAVETSLYDVMALRMTYNAN